MSDNEENKPENEDNVVEPLDSAEPEAASGENNAPSSKASDSSDVSQSAGDDEEEQDYDPMAALSERKEEAKKASSQKDKKPKQDEYTKVVRQSRVQAEKQQQLKKKAILGIVGAIVLMIAGFFMYMMTPYKGGMTYGICKVFLERALTFPSTLELKGVEDFGNSVRIWYMTIDSFGNNRMQPIQCYYQPDNGSGYLQIEKVQIRRRDVDQAIVDDFNKTIPAIYAYPPDLALPYTAEDALENLHYEVNQYRKPIF